MGYSEFDRIRNKNRVWNAADLEISRLREQNLTDNDIVNVCKTQLETNPTDPRNDIYSTILRIVGGSHEVVSN